MAIDKRWAVCIVFTSVIVVAAIVVPVVVMSRGTDSQTTSQINDPFLEAQQSGSRVAGGSGSRQFVEEGGVGAGTGMLASSGRAGAVNGGAMAPSEMVVQFGSMIDCVVDRGSIAFNGYGCYCGLGGGGKPVDAIDRCCREHDMCYNMAKQQGICKGDKSVYVTWYRMDRSRCNTPKARITCDHHARYSFFDSLLAGRQSRCAATLCECDRTTAMCFARHSKSYNLNYAAYQSKNAGSC